MIFSLVSSPHAHDHSSVQRIMVHVCFALLPCTAFGIYLFGLPALFLFVLTVFSAVLTEALCLKLAGKPWHRIHDSSALLTGWLLAISLPPWAPWWIGVSGSVIAIAIGKQLYGGIGQNVFNPAMLARAALLLSFPVHLTTWPAVQSGFFDIGLIDSLSVTFSGTIPDGMTGATTLGDLKTQISAQQTTADTFSQSLSMQSQFMGITPGSLGETSAILILLGGLWLLAMRVITWHIPVSMLFTVAVLATVLNLIDPQHYSGVSFHLFSGSLLLGAFFIATDLVTSPASRSGQIVFGSGCGLLEYVIRTWGGYPEGISFAVLFMNALTPLIDIYFRPRIYGRRNNRKPKPLQVKSSPAASEIKGATMSMNEGDIVDGREIR